jgi:hypothetical protein
MPNRKAQVTVTEEREIEDQHVPGVTNSWVYEQMTTGLPNGRGATRYVAGNVDRILFVVTCSGYLDAWPWAEVTSIAASQAVKVRRAVDPAKQGGSQ